MSHIHPNARQFSQLTKSLDVEGAMFGEAVEHREERLRDFNMV